MKSVLGDLLPKERSVVLFKGKGSASNTACTTCGGNGYVGRIGIFEVFPVTAAISKLVLGRAPMADIEKEAVAEGMIAMKQDGYLKALEGVTTLEEVLRVAQD